MAGCQHISFKNHQGYIIRTKIEWCRDHCPEHILKDAGADNLELLRESGRMY
jgi:hypothetical protein